MPDEVVKFSKKAGSSILKAMEHDPEKVGGILIKIASERHDKDFTESVVERVKELIKHRQALQLALQKTQSEIALFDARIDAIENGEFKIDGYGRISYNDSVLNY